MNFDEFQKTLKEKIWINISIPNLSLFHGYHWILINKSYKSYEIQLQYINSVKIHNSF